jgi:hypothetical protein
MGAALAEKGWATTWGAALMEGTTCCRICMGVALAGWGIALPTTRVLVPGFCSGRGAPMHRMGALRRGLGGAPPGEGVGRDRVNACVCAGLDGGGGFPLHYGYAEIAVRYRSF